ncbi:MAG: hypothetical protein AAF824_07090 [Bacteroidota bacterium]
MGAYRSREIVFREQIQVDDWTLKVYTISVSGAFEHEDFYAQVKQLLPVWLQLKNSFNAQHDHLGFVILHEATEGIFSLVNWWIGGNMINTHVFLTPHGTPDQFTQISGDGLFACVWEMEVLNHERLAWITHVLKNNDTQAYLEDVTYARI